MQRFLPPSGRAHKRSKRVEKGRFSATVGGSLIIPEQLPIEHSQSDSSDETAGRNKRGISHALKIKMSLIVPQASSTIHHWPAIYRNRKIPLA